MLSIDDLVRKVRGIQRITEVAKYSFILFFAGVNGLLRVRIKSIQRQALRANVSKLKYSKKKSLE
jgi:hypothetical protein